MSSVDAAPDDANEQKITEPQTTIEKLALRHFEVFGESPEYSFWAWLDAIGADPNEKTLLAILNDKEYWQT